MRVDLLQPLAELLDLPVDLPKLQGVFIAVIVHQFLVVLLDHLVVEVVVLDLPQKIFELAVLGLYLLVGEGVLVPLDFEVALPAELIFGVKALPFGDVEVFVGAVDGDIGVQVEAHLPVLWEVLIIEVDAVLPSQPSSLHLLLRLDFILKDDLPGPLLEPPQLAVQYFPLFKLFLISVLDVLHLLDRLRQDLRLLLEDAGLVVDVKVVIDDSVVPILIGEVVGPHFIVQILVVVLKTREFYITRRALLSMLLTLLSSS